MQRHGVDHQIMCAGLKPQHVIVGHTNRIRKHRAPHIGKRRDHGDLGKGSVNHAQAILNILGCGLMQEQGGRVRDTGAVHQQSGAISDVILV